MKCLLRNKYKENPWIRWCVQTFHRNCMCRCSITMIHMLYSYSQWKPKFFELKKQIRCVVSLCNLSHIHNKDISWSWWLCLTTLSCCDWTVDCIHAKNKNKSVLASQTWAFCIYVLVYLKRTKSLHSYSHLRCQHL